MLLKEAYYAQLVYPGYMILFEIAVYEMVLYSLIRRR
jgi:hypothetical protein